MRHTALTRIADKCRDPFAVMKIAGHSTLALTQRYCHPPQQAVERALMLWWGGWAQNWAQGANSTENQSKAPGREHADTIDPTNGLDGAGRGT